MCIINTLGCNIFENLSSVDYTRCLDLMQDIILGIEHYFLPLICLLLFKTCFLFFTATDVSHHLSIFRKLEDLATSGFEKNRADHHQLLLFLMMTTADLSDQTKGESKRLLKKLFHYSFFFSPPTIDWNSSKNAAVCFKTIYIARNSFLFYNSSLFSAAARLSRIFLPRRFRKENGKSAR